MHVGVEATRLLREQRGIGRYVRALLPLMAAERSDLRFTFFPKGRDVRALTESLVGDPVLGPISTVQSIRSMRNARADLFWFPWNVVRPIPRHAPIVVTVHDAVPIALTPPGWRTWQKRRRWWRLYRDTVKHAAMLLADSTFTADEIVRLLDEPRERIRVVLLGADDQTAPPGDSDALLAALGVSKPYVLAVGADEPRKNFGVLYDAMDRVHAVRPELTLVRVGPIAHLINDHETSAGWMHRLGFVRDEELDALYRNAAAFVCPSTYEGFGLPVLEAMHRGAPVIAAQASSLPEVAGAAAHYFPPHDTALLAAAIESVLANDAVREAMVTAGRARAAEFRWANTAHATLAAFDEARAK